jgi:hypothetical protein
MSGGTGGCGVGADGNMDRESVADPGALRVSPSDGATRSACVGSLFVICIDYA